MKRKDFFLLLLLTLGALLLHGYHPWAEDAAIYLPGVEKILQPELFPFNAQFFESHAHLTLFPNLIAASVQATHLPLEAALFAWHVASVFLFLLACWELSGKCFVDRRARWAGVCLIAALFTLPVAGTGLYLMDQYLNPRNLTAFAAIFAVARVLERKYVQGGLFLVFAAAIHPLMAVFTFSFCAVLVCLREFDGRSKVAACLLPFGISIGNPSQAYHQVALLHPNHYLWRWHWYECLGAVTPLAILWWFSRMARSRQLRNVDLLCRALIVYQLVYLGMALLTSLPSRFEDLARLQLMRSLYLLYILMILIAGGFLGEYVLKNRLGRWVALLVPLCAGMFIAQRSLFPGSAHVEWPGMQPRNSWVQAFQWIRNNTPPDAIFALDPYHMSIPGEDANGFRAVAQRSMLADAVKDSGAVTMFPALADEWLTQVQAQNRWGQFQLQDFQRLRSQYGVTWVVVRQPVAGLDCPYRNDAVRVCRIE
ncbi:MAG TPA: hypothetical protein VGP65_08570 [Candidatus Angelobacter sp.]|nr:hypothetical protein [Candidatus Angelobacter sp.]